VSFADFLPPHVAWPILIKSGSLAIALQHRDSVRLADDVELSAKIVVSIGC